MSIEEYGEYFASALSESSIAVLPETALHAVAADIMGMAEAYCSDGHEFFRQCDRVNAHAAYTYGFGWLDAGCALGFLNGRVVNDNMPWFEEIMPFDLKAHLEEKCGRYERMLRDALDSIVPAPDRSSEMYAVAGRIHLRGSTCLDQGDRYLRQGALVNALGFFSYGYGWLDAGVRAGLFCICGDRELFTV